MNEKLIVAHRGESFIAPENTLSSINLAWQNGADAVEIDIRLTKDNQVVVKSWMLVSIKIKSIKVSKFQPFWRFLKLYPKIKKY